MSHTLIKVSVNAPSAYWENYASPVAGVRVVIAGEEFQLLKTHRSGADGQSDAGYIVDRMASGLYWAQVVNL